MEEEKLTPMKRQYRELKEKNRDCILFFRLGDFYEMFDEDARLAAKELDLTLTTRDRGKPVQEQTPMCGVPYHSVDSYIARLISKGYKVAICEQLEDPATAKGLVDRNVTRIVTPGTVTESAMLDESRNNYFGCVCGRNGEYGVAFCDISTGAFYATTSASAADAAAELGRFAPTEVLRFGPGVKDPALETALRKLGCCLDEGGEGPCSCQEAAEALRSHFHAELADLGLGGREAASYACGALLRTLQELRKNDLSHLRKLEYYDTGRFLELDMDARRNLELTETLRSRDKRGSLLWVLDRTRTPMGSRTLRSWLEKPLLDPNEIQRRLGAVEELTGQAIARGQLREALAGVTDLERAMTRVATGTANCRDLLGLATGFQALPEVLRQLESFHAPLLRGLAGAIDPMEALSGKILRTISDKAPLSLREGGLIQDGADPEVDRLRGLLKGGTEAVTAIETAERERTGIRTLRAGYNRVFGYYIEVSKSFASQVPQEYIRRQTLTNTERFITPELKELEYQIITAKDRLAELEYRLFTQLREEAAGEAGKVQAVAAAAGAVDALASLAETAVRNRYVRPEISLDGRIDITDGRHPVVERMLEDSLFVPNDTHMDLAGSQVCILTGPNMAGKSTYMRQVALITILAQMGSFVPAKAARIGIVDRVFTRIGASDDLASGRSTFMVEMSEVASILRSATSRSLLILDEIGRGTSTYDGMAIARAVLEYVADPKRLGAKTLFATHYHELSDIEAELPNVKNFSIAVKKRGEQMIFLRKILPGAADHSYGVEVARLAGLPAPLVNRARDILKSLEAQGAPPRRPDEKEPEDQVSLLDLRSQDVCRALENLHVETLTPIEAINELFKLKKMLE